MNGNRTALRKRDTQVINYTYDLLNRMTVKDLPGAFADFTYGYDNLGRQTSAVRAGMAITNSYDALGRLIVEQQPFGRIESQYDLAGNRTRVTYTDGNFFTFDHDDASRLKVIKENGATSLATLTYDTPGRLQTVTRANGTSTTHTYDPISRLASLNQDLNLAPSDVTFSFTYSNASQILTRTLTNDLYAFTGFTGSTKSYTVNGLNQYTAIAGALPSHDANGNLANDGAGQAYSYDPENRLIAASGPRNATLGYDPMGRLAQVSDVATRRMAYDGDALAEEYDGSGNLLRRFVHGPGVDDPIIWYEGATLADRRFLHADHQGSIVAISDGSGNGTLNKYDEYGVPQSGFTGRFGYTGQAWVPELELWYYKARFYSPHAKDGGRFLQVDPVGYDDQINLYAYVGNDPVNLTDSAGEQPDSVMDRRNQAMLQAMDECTGRGAACAAAVGEGIAVAGAAVVTVATAGRAAPILGSVVGKSLGKAITTGTRVPNAKAGLGNPFKGKSNKEIGKMFDKKGFERKGTDPENRKGSFVNPRSGRQYYLDKGGSYRKGDEPPHVDVSRPKDYTGDLEKKKFPTDPLPE